MPPPATCLWPAAACGSSAASATPLELRLAAWPGLGAGDAALAERVTPPAAAAAVIAGPASSGSSPDVCCCCCCCCCSISSATLAAASLALTAGEPWSRATAAAAALTEPAESTTGVAAESGGLWLVVHPLRLPTAATAAAVKRSGPGSDVELAPSSSPTLCLAAAGWSRNMEGPAVPAAGWKCTMGELGKVGRASDVGVAMPCSGLTGLIESSSPACSSSSSAAAPVLGVHSSSCTAAASMGRLSETAFRRLCHRVRPMEAKQGQSFVVERES